MTTVTHPDLSKTIDDESVQRAVYLLENPHEIGKVLPASAKLADMNELHSYWIKTCFFSKDKTGHAQNVILEAHRNSFKSSALVVGVIIYLMFNPHNRVLIIRKSAKLAEDMLGQIKTLYSTDVIRWMYKTLFGVEQIQTTNWTQESITISTKKSITTGASVAAYGCTRDFVGSHVDLIIADDCITTADKDSDAENDRTIRFFQTLSPILEVTNPESRMIICNTPYRLDDSIAYLKKNTDYLQLHYPLGTTGVTVPQKTLDNDFRRMGPEFYSLSYTLKVLSSDQLLFSNPLVGIHPSDLTYFAYLDTATSNRSSADRTALAIAAHDKTNDKYYCTVFSWRKATVALYPDILNLLNQWQVKTLYVETNQDGGRVLDDIKAFPYRAEGVRIPSTIKGRKHTRVMHYVNMFWDKIIFAPDTPEEPMKRLAQYFEGMNRGDDEIDALAGVMEQLTKRQSSGYALLPDFYSYGL